MEEEQNIEIIEEKYKLLSDFVDEDEIKSAGAPIASCSFNDIKTLMNAMLVVSLKAFPINHIY
ncbi:hypothetical protein O9G_005907 [Rozella allomycis CSF55]|uniref:Uncharacterized protein n=1 Tax=Rozella allomycis (strain CSF55) TaxID=988480 RepID=A0A075B113_ROZAC|nr:hypothetical protein O9G_005907 [Rozella allomycis CSF55]|eukprot:EPZ34516.1 hypothetical protein O9G_005907 [Rozella allomycis CSF55]